MCEERENIKCVRRGRTLRCVRRGEDITVCEEGGH